jgi:hypothetical protein
LKLALAVVVLAACCATSTAAPLGSPSASIHIASPAWDAPIDPGLNSPAIAEQSIRAAEEASPVQRDLPIAPAAVSAGTALAFSAVFLVSKRSLRRQGHRGRRVRRQLRTMAYLS